MRGGVLLVGAFLASGCASVPETGGGVTHHYVRSNIAGGEEEQVLMHLSSPTEIAVAKLRERCTRAALVTATIDPDTGEAFRLEAAQLQPDGSGKPYGEMRFDPTRQEIVAKVTMDGRTLEDGVQVATRPWHLYDYDLATLVAATRAWRTPPDRFAFGLALVWPGDDPARFLQWLGPADARLVGPERHEGRAALRYEVSGPAFGAAGGGPLWVDAASLLPIDVRWGRPSHPGYDDFRLRLVASRVEDEAAWRRRLAGHFTGCSPDRD